MKPNGTFNIFMNSTVTVGSDWGLRQRNHSELLATGLTVDQVVEFCDTRPGRAMHVNPYGLVCWDGVKDAYGPARLLNSDERVIGEDVREHLSALQAEGYIQIGSDPSLKIYAVVT